MNGMGKKLRQLRGDRKQSEIAAEISRNYQPLASSSYAMYENDQREPNFNTLIALADFYGVSTDFLLGRSDCSSVSEDIQSACVTTGLSEETVKKLIDLRNYISTTNKLYPPFYGKGAIRLIEQIINNGNLVNLAFDISFLAHFQKLASEIEMTEMEQPLPEDDISAVLSDALNLPVSALVPRDQINVAEYNISEEFRKIIDSCKSIASDVAQISYQMDYEKFKKALYSREKEIIYTYIDRLKKEIKEDDANAEA